MAALLNELQIILFDKSNYSTLVLFADISNRVSNLSFSTRIPGGFEFCDFKITLPRGMAHNWYAIAPIHYFKLEIRCGQEIVWEGRVEDVEVIPEGLQVHCAGFFSSCRDRGEPTASVAGADADAQIADILTDACVDINSDQSNIGNSGAAALASFTSNIAQDMILQLAGQGNGSGAVWDFAIWEAPLSDTDRAPTAYFAARPTSTITWRTSLDKFVGQSLGLRRSIYDLVNRYSNADISSTLSEDTTSQTEYKRRDRVATIDTNEAETVITRQKDMPPSGRSSIGLVYTTSGAIRPLWAVRAGTLLQIDDVAYIGRQITTVRDQLAVLYIARTVYNADQNTLEIEWEGPAVGIASMLQAAGVK